MDDKQIVDLAVETAKMMVRAAVQTIGDVDDETRNLTLSMALGMVMVTFKYIDKDIPHTAAATYLRQHHDQV
jgi:hypothetical protein